MRGIKTSWLAQMKQQAPYCEYGSLQRQYFLERPKMEMWDYTQINLGNWPSRI